MVRQNCFYKGSKLTTTYKTLILLAANMWSLSKTLNIMATNISGFTVFKILATLCREAPLPF